MAPRHLGAKRSSLTSPPKIKMWLTHRQLQTSLLSKAVLATCSVLGTSHRSASAGGPFLHAQRWHAWGLASRDRASFVCPVPPCPAFPAGPRDDGSLATSTCSHAASAVTPAPCICLWVPAVTRLWSPAHATHRLCSVGSHRSPGEVRDQIPQGHPVQTPRRPWR